MTVTAPALAKPLTRRRVATRARLLDAARGAFTEKGFHGASVEDICERAGFTRGAFYSNFASKDELFLLLCEEQASTTIARVAASLDSADRSPEHVVRAALDALVSHARASEDWHVLMTEFELHAIRTPSARAAWSAQQRRLRRSVGTVIDKALRERDIELPMSTDVFVRIYLALSRGSLSARLIDPRSLRQGELERTVLPLLLGLDT